MRRTVPWIVLGLALGLASLAQSSAPPKPSVVPVSWELDFEHQTPQPITLRLPGEDKSVRYWYMLYIVTNKSKSDQYFIPDLTLCTETGQVRRAGVGVPAAVFDAVQKRHNNPLLVDQATITGKILQGDDNAKHGVAIWPEYDPAARAFDIFVGGLSGERAKVELPASAPSAEPPKKAAAEAPGEKAEAAAEGQEQPAKKPAEKPADKSREVTLSKTLRLSFSIPGEASARDRNAPALVSREWVMR